MKANKGVVRVELGCLHCGYDIGEVEGRRTAHPEDLINYSAALAAAKGSPAIYFVQGRSAPNQVSVFGSEPGEKDYSPLWTETTVTWKAGAKPTLLTSDNQIASLVQKGKLTVHATGVILNCPIVSIGK